MKRSLPLLLALALTISSCDKRDELDASIAGIAVANPDFSVLEDAAVRGGLVGTLTEKNRNDPSGNFTVFAPNNAAFARLGLRSASDLLVLQQPFLTQTLLYHTSNGSLVGDYLTPGTTAPSLLGPPRRFITRNNVLYVNGSRVLATDIKAANGTVHAIDKVMLATGADIVQSALALQTSKVFVQPELTYLVEALVYCDLVPALTASTGSPSFTVYAPTDAAFKNLFRALSTPTMTLETPADIRKLSKATVTNILLNHVVADGGRFTSELPENTSVASLGGPAQPVRIGPFTDGTLTLRGVNNTIPANMVIPDILCTNGVVHLIDQVLLP
ncbi:fasciclin domain-containing protein [Hymenobacter sp. BT175]|uniref:fasciclin domain-containing protein n=1 Tax=Hymenobacter translucens TaxID=2886507 RepID=UPI001D0DEB52|nr:fasciclin domain-containing protein [Hymenobacter translucens]MCC2548834.1 fasciclin domain-containing protein [Hymenobacter translucens]